MGLTLKNTSYNYINIMIVSYLEAAPTKKWWKRGWLDLVSIIFLMGWNLKYFLKSSHLSYRYVELGRWLFHFWNQPQQRWWKEVGRIWGVPKNAREDSPTHCTTYQNSPVFSTGRWWSSKTPWERFIFCSKIIKFSLCILNLFKEILNDHLSYTS